MTITGPAAPLTIARSQAASAPHFRIFTVDSGVTAVVTGLTFADGNDGAGDDGGVNNFGNLTLDQVIVRDSVGTGVSNFGTMVLTNSTVIGNRAGQPGNPSFSQGFGGGVANVGKLTLINDTIYGNTATFDGAGFYNFAGNATLDFVTIAGNTAQSDGNGYGSGGGIAVASGTVTLTDTIVAGNMHGIGAGTPDDISGAVDPSSSYNLVGVDTNLSGISNGANHNQIGTAASPIDPKLAPLAGYGGPTPSEALLPGSPAIGAGTAITGVNTDQRGVARGASIDVGAFESRGFTIAIMSGNAQSTAVGTSFLNPLVLTVSSPYGDPVQGGVLTFTAPGSGASATLAGGTGATATAAISPTGQATVAVTANTVPGSYSVTATAGGAASSATFSLTNTAGAAASITATGGTSQSTTVDTAFGAPLQVLVADAYGNPVPGASVAFAAPGTGASGNFGGGAVVTTNAQGIAGPAFTANTKAGSYAVTASVSGAATPASFSLINTPGAAASVVATAGTNQAATIVTAFATALQVLVSDAYGNAVPGASVTFAAPASGAGGSFYTGGTSTIATDGSGHATAPTFTSNTKAGSFGVIALVSGVTSPASFSLTNTAGAAASVTATAGITQSTTVNTAFAIPLQVLVVDAYGNAVPGASVTFAAPISGASGSVSGGAVVTTNAQGLAAPTVTANTKAGSYMVSASVSGVGIAAGFSLTNTPGAAASITAMAGTPQSTTVAYAFASPLQVVVADAYGNPVPAMSVTFVAPTSGASGSFSGGAAVATNAQGIAAPTFTANTKAGSYAVSATVSGVATPVSFSLTNTPDVASSLAITATSAVTKGVPFSFTVTAMDRYGNIATGYRGTVQFSSSDRKASLPANYPFVAADNGMHTFQSTFNSMGSLTLTVADTLASSLTSTATLTVSPKGGTAALTANQSPAGVPPGAQIGALHAQARRRAIHRVAAQGHHGVRLRVPSHPERLAPKS